ncbi:Prefoldin subunit-domain-containing protein [Dichotomopilus funicola]|uniref:Prefoldin subunit-domain-containing protein n=1 Tax=Dichotomopilus funicola TaxID=1934379 RepID=A0AAN6UZN9_9PEZI|nr:Prefoldin subunit-domain-containing protein [Dichotomopilus funicola]
MASQQQPPPATKDHLSDLDRHVQLLEDKVNKLRASLTHWQQWYLEYSSLKEDIEQLPRDPVPLEQLRRLRRDFDSPLLTQKELYEIMGKGDDLRTVDKIVATLARRMEYVEQNIGSVEKLLEVEERRLEGAITVAQPGGGVDEESGLPLTDIIEELDEEGNVVGFRLQGGAEVGPGIVEALGKAGIREGDLPEEILEEEEGGGELMKGLAALGVGEKKEQTSSIAGPSSGAAAAAPAADEPAPRKKSVSFAEDTKTGDEEAETAPSVAAQNLERLMQKAREQEAMDLSTAVIPDNESAEENQLRREMLEYGMSEIGPVVAELQLEEDYSGDDDDMDWLGSDDEGFEDEDTDDDAEDDLGRSTRKVVTSDYVKRMQELEKRLGVQSAFTVGAKETESKKQDEGIGRIAVVAEPSSSAAEASTAPAASKGKKSVSFASTLDIAPETVPQPAPEVKSKERKIAEVGDIVEKVTTTEEEEETLKDPEEPPKRVSRFKKERAGASSSSASFPPGPQQLLATFGASSTRSVPEPAPPEDTTLANTVVERASAAEPAEPDDMDDAMLYQAASVEYNRLRNQLIQKQGGFAQQEATVLDSESGRVPLDEELGGPKRMSKFKAARLAKLQ